MNNYFEIVRNYLLELEYSIDQEDEYEGLFLVSNESSGIKNLVIICTNPILIIEQFLFEIRLESVELFKNLLMKNRDIVHGAFVLDDEGKKVIFRDTLQLRSLDLNEIEASINSLSLLLGEYSDELIKYSKY